MATRIHPSGVAASSSSEHAEEPSRSAFASPGGASSGRPKLPHELPQDGKNNSRKFAARFKIPLLPFQTAPPQGTGKKPLSNVSIGTPVIRENTALKTIKEPAHAELIAEVESFRQASLAKNNSSTMVDWDAFASKHTHLAADIHAFRKRLDNIDARMNRAINELRLTVYEDIRNATERLTPQYEKTAREDTKKTVKERFAFGAARQAMRDARLAVRAQAVKNEVGKDVQAAIGRFTQRVKDDFEPERPKDIREACVELLSTHFGSAAPSGPLAELVNRISPEAIAKFRTTQGTAETASPVETGRQYGAKGPPPAPPPRWSKLHRMNTNPPPLGDQADKKLQSPGPTATQRSAKGPPPVPPPRWSKR